MPERPRAGERVYRGIPVSVGICRGKVLVIGQANHAVPVRSISESEVAHELHRLEQALKQTRHQISEVQQRVEEALGAGDASIFEAHLLVLEDPTLIEEVSRVTSEERINIEAAFERVANKYATALADMNDDYLRERASDMRDVTSRVLDNLLQRTAHLNLQDLAEPSIIVCPDLPPSAAAAIDRKKVLGLATDTGSKTSHTAIMARSLQIPAIAGLHDITSKLTTGDYVLLDGYNGTLVVNPTDQTQFEYGQIAQKQLELKEKLRDLTDQPAVTLDGVRILLRANIEQPADAEAVKACGADGVGLFRTEYLFINREQPPTEEEQYIAYRTAAEALKPNPVVIRTLDIGGDKLLTYSNIPPEINPFLGWRAIRFCLVEQALFRDQLRAILRASVHGCVKILYPMISCVNELMQANALLEKARAELRSENIPFDERMEIGAMIEVPAAALIAPALAQHVQFFSIGTNDLIQYALAVDRMNERIAHLYEPTHPGILALIKMTADAAQQRGISVSVCGEMAGDPALIPLLVGLGITELSASPPLVPQIKFLIRRLKMTEARALASFAQQCDSGPEILLRSQALTREIAPSLFEAREQT